MREAEIKAALIDRLFADGFIDDSTVIISELPVSSWSRRADLVLANGKILGFEIKSKFDSTTRLSAQLDAYATTFEGVSVVIDKKHLDAAAAVAQASVGIFTIHFEDNSARIELVRKPHLKALSLEASIKLMLTDDLRRLLFTQGAKPLQTYGRQRLEDDVRSLGLTIVRTAAREALKRRYLSYYREFVTSRKSGRPTIEALPSLRRPSWAKPAAITEPTVKSLLLREPEFLKQATPNLTVTPRRVSS